MVPYPDEGMKAGEKVKEKWSERIESVREIVTEYEPLSQSQRGHGKAQK